MPSIRTARTGLALHDETIPACLASADGRRPRWLLTPYASDTWRVTDTGHKPSRSLRFDIALPGGRRLGDHPNLLDTVKRVVFGIRHGPLLRVESGSVQAEKASSLLVLARWMVVNRIERFEDLNASDQWEYAQLAAGGIHDILNTEGTLSRHLQSLAEQLDFAEVDTLHQRRTKSRRLLPVRGYRGKQTYLDRERLMADAGLDGIRLPGARDPLCRLLDAFEATTALDLPGHVRRRLASPPSVEDIEERPMTSETIRRLLMPFVLLYEHRRYLDDALRTPPFQGQALKDVAKRLGSGIGRTPTVPVTQAATLIERSVRWVLDYAPPILEAKEALDDGRIPQMMPTGPAASGPATPFPLRPGHQSERASEPGFGVVRPATPGAGMALRTALNYLAVACGVVIAAFSARRAAEIVGLRRGCIKRDDTGGPWLQSFIHKTVQSDGTVPVPEVVAAAVAVLERLSARARQRTGTEYLFQFNLPASDAVVGLGRDGVPVFQLGSLMREFGYFVDVPPLEDGSRWTFRPHQFRRFFAVLYVWCYDLADWGALAHHLRHFDLEMTRRYVSDADLGTILNQANRQRTAEVLAGVALGNRRLAGPAGERLSKSVQSLHVRLAQRVQVVPERKLHQRIMRFVERSNLELRAIPWGYCALPDAAGLPAVCSGGTGPATPEAASVATCSDCSRSVRAPEFRPYLAAALARHRTIAESAHAPPLMRRASHALCRELHEYLGSLDPDPTPPQVTA